MNILKNPEILLLLNLEVQELQNNDLILTADLNKVQQACAKLVTMLPSSRLNDTYADRLSQLDFINVHMTANSIRRGLTVDQSNALYHFKSAFYDKLDVDQEVRKYVNVMIPLIDDLYELEKVRTELLEKHLKF